MVLHPKRGFLIIKRAFDVAFSLVCLAVLIIPFILVAILIKLESRGPVFFTQDRFGMYKSMFRIYKFRTMRFDAPKDVPTHLFDEANFYITRVGHFLRKTSLDELPQLFNILIGEMSVVGPRPALWNQHDLIAERDRYGANDVRPGLTGWAQVNGRDELPIDVKAKLDGDYVASMSVRFDLKCLWRTVRAVISQDGISEGRHD